MQGDFGDADGRRIIQRPDGSFAAVDAHGVASGAFATRSEALAAAERQPRGSRTDDAPTDEGGANPRQHLVGDYGAPPPPSGRRSEALPTGDDTAGARDVSDPHPANEEYYDRERHPGGANPPRDPGPNDRIHAGSPPPRQPGPAPAAAPLHTGGRTEVPTDGDDRPMGGTNRLAGWSGLGMGLGVVIAVLLLVAVVLTLTTGTPGPDL